MAKTYSAPGTYTVKLTATNSAGSNTVIKTALITVNATYNEVFALTPNPSTVGIASTYTISGGKPNTAFNWTSTDGGSGSGTLNGSGTYSYTYSYSTPGSFTVTANFPSTGHVRSLNVTVVANEVVSLTPSTIIAGNTSTVNITGGIPNTAFTYSSTDGTSGSGILDNLGRFTSTGVYYPVPGSYTLSVNFSGSNHSRFLNITSVANEILSLTPSTFPAGSVSTVAITGGLPNSAFSYVSSDGTSGSGVLDAGGSYSSSQAYYPVPGTYTLTVTFPASGHTRSITVTSVANEVVSFSPNPKAAAALGTISLTGGVPNSGFSYTSSDGTLGTGVLSAAGTYSATGAYYPVPGSYTLNVTFPATGHTRSIVITTT